MPRRRSNHRNYQGTGEGRHQPRDRYRTGGHFGRHHHFRRHGSCTYRHLLQLPHQAGNGGCTGRGSLMKSPGDESIHRTDPALHRNCGNSLFCARPSVPDGLVDSLEDTLSINTVM